jgi:hypothetical protein
MLQSISWQTYLSTCSSTLVLYYAIIAFIFYRKDWVLKINPDKQSVLPIETTEFKNAMHTGFSSVINNKVDEFSNYISTGDTEIADALVDELQALTKAMDVKCIKAELMQAIKNVLRKYPSLNSFFYQEIINRVIAEECETNGLIVLEKQEIAGLWHD